MKALILAAGLGTRLYPLTNDRPKAMVTVNGKPILFKQIDNLLENGITDITIVAGYKADILKKKVFSNYSGINIIESKDYAVTNNMYSAYLGMKTMFKNGTWEPFLMMNADVFFDASIIAELIKDERENLIVVDIGTYNEESMKVIKRDERISKISKQIAIEDARGCSIDVYKFGIEGGRAFGSQCTKYIEEKKELQRWSEVALNDILNDVTFHECQLKGRWIEIDNHEDLLMGEQIFCNKNESNSANN